MCSLVDAFNIKKEGSYPYCQQALTERIGLSSTVSYQIFSREQPLKSTLALGEHRPPPMYVVKSTWEYPDYFCIQVTQHLIGFKLDQDQFSDFFSEEDPKSRICVILQTKKLAN